MATVQLPRGETGTRGGQHQTRQSLDQVVSTHLDHGAVGVDAALGRHRVQAAVLSCGNATRVSSGG